MGDVVPFRKVKRPPPTVERAWSNWAFASVLLGLTLLVLPFTLFNRD